LALVGTTPPLSSAGIRNKHEQQTMANTAQLDRRAACHYFW
jgi:hypothetical protein